MPFQPHPLMFSPGIQRDSTAYASDSYLDGQWCRFQYGRPRKIGGYRAVSPNLLGVSRALHSQTHGGFSYIHSGYAGGIEVLQVDPTGITSLPSERAPGGFVSDANNVWQLDSYYDTNSGAQQILAFVVPALLDIGYGAAVGTLYSGSVYTTAALTKDTDASISTDATGGVVVVPPYAILYGSNGLVQWSLPGQPLVFTDNGTGQAGAARVTAQKIVRGLPVRGGGATGGYSPQLLLWSLDSIIHMYFVGGPTVFQFDTLSAQSSILSHNAAIEVDGVFYWIGQDRFLRYAGEGLQELPNTRNLNWFFDNLNRTYSQKVFVMKNSRFGEVWFCAPLFGATEPNHAAIFNYRENTWYDTPLPNSGRSYGIHSDISATQLMSGIEVYPGGTYRLWQHETGVNEEDVVQERAVRSFFTTGILSAESFQQPADRNLHIDTVLPDFKQSGDMILTAATRGNARSAFTAAPSVTFGATADSPADQQVPLKVTARQITLNFESNTLGGDYQCGRSIVYIDTDGARRTQ